MKKIFSFFVFCFFIGVYAQAKMWRVSNVFGVIADFTTVQSAHDAANAGDTIQIEPSISEYGSLVTSKRLVWFGTGHFLDDNPGNQFSVTPATVSFITIHIGSENSIFSGLRLSSNLDIFCANVTIKRCYIINLSVQPSVVDAILTQNFIQGQVLLFDSQGSVFSNNIVGMIFMNPNASANITNNIITARSVSSTIQNSVFQNNIIVDTFTTFFFNSNVSYNFHSSHSLPIGNNNQNNVDMSTVFVNATGHVDKDFILKPGSPAIGAGPAGVDLGAFGGSTPYKLALQPAIPAILNISAPASVTSNIIQIRFSAKSNN